MEKKFTCLTSQFFYTQGFFVKVLDENEKLFKLGHVWYQTKCSDQYKLIDMKNLYV